MVDFMTKPTTISALRAALEKWGTVGRKPGKSISIKPRASVSISLRRGGKSSTFRAAVRKPVADADEAGPAVEVVEV
jgi:hypothetical protein